MYRHALIKTERVLRVLVRHRGFQVCSMNMEAATDAQNINILIDRCQSPVVESLHCSQLSKLVECLCRNLPTYYIYKSAPERKRKKK
ncbi:acetolactate synthase 2 small subunit [Salmonella enterica subsp. enterica]|nr:acetolactate synthase 2 small subunit [Salmonella enterica subsp. enterica]